MSARIPFMFFPISFTAAVNSRSRRPVMKTYAPSLTNSCAVARPIPLFPPVISATFLRACPQVFLLSSGSLFAPQDHDCAADLCDELSVTAEDVANISADGFSHMYGSGDCTKPVVPHRAEEIDLQIEAGKAFSLTQARGVSCSNRSIRDVA